jgi:DNA-binding winged helix-turn-helix (wHTH) protein/TolB-like protein
MSQPSGRVYGFGPFRYDAGQRLLFREGELVPLVPKALETLHVLLERRGRVVDKAELMRLVWPDTTVEEVGLARNISLLRKALGGESEAETYIETIPKRGYRFVGEVKEPTDAPRPARRPWTAWSAAAAALLLVGGLVYWQFYMPSRYLPRGEGFAALAVIPFECLSQDLEKSTFAQGLNELLVAELARMEGVQVVSPTTVRRYQRFRISTAMMARLLGLEVLVEGTAQKLGDRLRVTARLVDVHTGKLIWAESYEYASTDLDQVQAQAARAAAAQIRAHLAIRPRPAGSIH